MRPIHLCALKDELRPSMGYIQVLRNRVIAADTFVLIVLPVKEVFGPDIINEDEELYFNAEEWKKSKFYKATLVGREGNTFYGAIGKQTTEIKALNREQYLEKTKGTDFPHYEVVFPQNTEERPVTNLCIRPGSLVSLVKCFDVQFAELRFYNAGGNIVVTNPESKGVGLITQAVSMFEPIDIEYRLGLTKESLEDLL